MELNVLNFAGKVFQLEKGDRFYTNGSCFTYAPIGKENRRKVPRGSDAWSTRTTMNCKKYWKQVEKADNIRVVPQSEYKKSDVGWKIIYEVEYAYKEDVRTFEGLMMLVIDTHYHTGESIQLNAYECPVERETKECYFFKSHCPIIYHSKILKSELDKMVPRYGREMYVICKIEDAQDMQDKLFVAFEKMLNTNLEVAEDAVKSAQGVLKKFETLKEINGY